MLQCPVKVNVFQGRDNSSMPLFCLPTDPENSASGKMQEFLSIFFRKFFYYENHRKLNKNNHYDYNQIY